MLWGFEWVLNTLGRGDLRETILLKRQSWVWSLLLGVFSVDGVGSGQSFLVFSRTSSNLFWLDTGRCRVGTGKNTPWRV